ncbi:unnamed protein product [Haemonchus placei]|uniref:S4 RNA-binding domain-containing protein n=1 Tax=Haemonchus placei TaxID=6290 RepID=A0A0N4X0H5_HAEPC|nr:unnamed protein product [Haemonchus placei]
MNACLLSRLSAGVRWQSALSCRHLRTGIPSLSQELGDDGLPKDYKIKTLKAGSRRLDTFVNRASGKSSSQVEKLILGGRVRVNEDVHTKKSYNVCRYAFISTSFRLSYTVLIFFQVTNYEVTEKGYDIHIKSWKKFLVENWRGGGA